MKQFSTTTVIFLLLCILHSRLIAQPVKPDYQSSTAYIIWYDNYTRYHQNQTYLPSGSNSGGSSGGGGRTVSRLERKIDRYLREQQREAAIQSQVNELYNAAEKQFWDAVAYYEKGDYPNALATYSNYQASVSKQLTYSQNNNVQAYTAGESTERFKERSYYEFLLNLKNNNYSSAFIFNPYTVYLDNERLNTFPYSTIKYFEGLGNITSASYKDLQGYFAIIRLLGQINICTDARNILNRLSPAVKDSIKNDEELFIEYGLAQVAARDYNGARQTFDEITAEKNDPLLTYAIAKEMNELFENNLSHDSSIMKYTCGLLDNAAKQTTDDKLLAGIAWLKGSITGKYNKSTRKPDCSKLSSYKEVYTQYHRFDMDTFAVWAADMTACGRFSEVKSYLESKLKEAADKNADLLDYTKSTQYPDIAEAANGLENAGYIEEAVQLYGLYNNEVLGKDKRVKRLKPGVEVNNAKLFCKTGDYKSGIECIDDYYSKLKRSERYEYMWVTDMQLWTAYCKMKMLLRLNRQAEAIAFWQQVFNNQSSAFTNINKSFPLINQYLTPEDMDVLIHGTMR